MLDPSSCECATFYSISSCHDGLRGVPLGNALLGRVIVELRRTFPKLETFATLSPIPGFRAWLANLAAAPSGVASNAAAAALASLEQSQWYADRDITAEAERHLVPLCAYYLVCVKRGGQPADSVARFHLRNGARLERINWLSDTSAAALGQSAGLMVNYLYLCSDSGREHDAFASASAAMASPQVMQLAEQASSLFGQ